MRKLTKEEQKTAKKISLILAQEALFYQKMPVGKTKSKAWTEGVAFGMKYMTVRVSELAGILSFTERIQKAIGWTATK